MNLVSLKHKILVNLFKVKIVGNYIKLIKLIIIKIIINKIIIIIKWKVYKNCIKMMLARPICRLSLTFMKKIYFKSCMSSMKKMSLTIQIFLISSIKIKKFHHLLKKTIDLVKQFIKPAHVKFFTRIDDANTLRNLVWKRPLSVVLISGGQA